MALYSDLKTRIITELSRDDLSDTLATQLTTHIASACEYYADRKFWFNTVFTTVATVASTATVAIPATVRRVEKVTIPAYYTELRECTLAQLPDTGERGVPLQYAYFNDSLRFYPVPDAAYTLNIFGTAQVAAPTLAADTNVWTTEAYDLITAHTKFTLCRGQFRDPEGAQLAQAETQDALKRLLTETAKRLATPLRATQRGQRYNINAG